MANETDAVSQLSVANAPRMRIRVTEMGVLRYVSRMVVRKGRAKIRHILNTEAN